MDGCLGKKGQKGTGQVGWLIKKGGQIFQPIIGETIFSNIPPLKCFSTQLWCYLYLLALIQLGIAFWQQFHILLKRRYSQLENVVVRTSM